MLDAIIDAIIDGRPPTMYVLEPSDLPRNCTSPHGTQSRYCNGACRCQPCSNANTAAHRRWRHGLTPPTKGNP